MLGFMSAVFVAAERGDSKRVEQLLAEHPRRGCETDYRDRTALHLAVEHGHLDVVDVLLAQKHIDCDARDCGGFTALHLAVELGHDNIVVRLLEKGVWAKGGTCNGLTCLHIAAINGHSMIVKRLLAADLVVETLDKRDRSPMDYAVEYGHEDVIAALVEGVKSKRESAELVLYRAIREGYDYLMVPQLLAQNPEVIHANYGEEENQSPLYIAAAEGHLSTVTWLLAQTPRLAEVEDDYGRKLFAFAAEFGYDAVMGELLVEKPHLIDIDYLILAAENGREKIVTQLLAAKPALVKESDLLDQTALHVAAAGGHEKIVAQLLTFDPTLIDAENNRRETALSLAFSKHGYASKTVKCLLTQGAPTKIDTNMFWKVLTKTTDALGEEVMKLMLDRKPELVRDPSMYGPILSYVFDFRRGSKLLFSEEMMLKCWQIYPEALHTPDYLGYTPFHVAIRCDNEFAMELVQGKFSLDEIMAAFAKCEKGCPHSRLRACLSLESWLNKDVVRVIEEYLGLGEANTNKRKREEPDTTVL